ncbi:RSP_7527 family protein [Jannaschia sp. 2305UL9-9]
MPNTVEIDFVEIENRARALRAAYVRELFASVAARFRLPARTAEA